MYQKTNRRKYKWKVLSIFLIISYIMDGVLLYTFFTKVSIFNFMYIVIKGIIIVLLIYMCSKISKTSEQLVKSDLKLQNIFDTLDVAIWSHDLKTDTLLITPGIEKLYRRSLKEFYQDHLLWKKVIFPEDFPVLKVREHELQKGEPVTSVYRILRPDGKVRWIQDRGIPTLDEEKQLIDFTSVIFDITERKESEHLYKSLVEMSPDMIAVIIDEKIEYINEAGLQLVCATDENQMLGVSVTRFIPEHVLNRIREEKLTRKVDDDDKVRMEIKLTRLDGNIIDMEFSIMDIMLGGKRAVQVIGRDITGRKKAEKTIQQMAYYDALTGLPNRHHFKKSLQEILSKPEVDRVAVLFLDLDRFKIINDTMGHSVGDNLLQKVAERLKETVGNEGIVSRQGGDEFIVMTVVDEERNLKELCQSILKQFKTSFEIDGEEFFITVSIGISLYPDDGKDEESLIKHADTAMYLAKDEGKNNFQFYTPHLDIHANRAMELEKGLRKAIENNELRLFYQPQVDLLTRRLIGIEALIRWEHADLGTISPCEFIPIAEETGLIVPIGQWVLRTACEQNKVWQNAGYRPIPIAVNISVVQLQNDRMDCFLKKLLQEIKLEPQFLDLEITESIMQNINRSTMILNKLKQIGVKISIDDFGTGYSSLSYLKHLPIDHIKIDKVFTDDIHNEHPKQGSIVKTIIDLGKNLNFNVIAEGIENEGQVQFLLENDCRYGQGYYFSKPRPAEEMEMIFKYW